MENNAARAAGRFVESVQSAIESLAQHPEAGSPKFLGIPRLAGLRSWPVRGFPAIRIYYLLAGNELRVIRILHGKRDINPLLEDEAEEA